MMILLATDLDNTLIYSYKKESGQGVCVEYKEGKALSYIEQQAYGLLQNLPETLELVPITTRSLEQYRRIRLYQDKIPHYALCTNGAVLLVDGEIDQTWLEESCAMIAEELAILKTAQQLLAQDKEIYLAPRMVDNIFVFAKSYNPQQSLKQLQEQINSEKIFLDQVGDKVYIFPKILDKGLGLRRLTKRLTAHYIISAGDSAFDVPMLKMADLAIIPPDQAMLEALRPSHANLICSGEQEVFARTILQHSIRICREFGAENEIPPRT